MTSHWKRRDLPNRSRQIRPYFMAYGLSVERGITCVPLAESFEPRFIHHRAFEKLATEDVMNQMNDVEDENLIIGAVAGELNGFIAIEFYGEGFAEALQRFLVLYCLDAEDMAIMSLCACPDTVYLVAFFSSQGHFVETGFHPKLRSTFIHGEGAMVPFPPLVGPNWDPVLTGRWLRGFNPVETSFPPIPEALLADLKAEESEDV